MGESPPQPPSEEIERVASEIARLPGIRDRVVFVGREGLVLFVGEDLAGSIDAPTVGEGFDAWLASGSIELVEPADSGDAPLSLSRLATALRSVLRIGGPEAGPEGDGSETHWFEWTVLGPLGDEPGVAFLVSDVTKAWAGLARMAEAERVRRRLTERVLGSQKLESLGALAGRVAHDFNNLLTPIVGNVGLALLDLPAESPLRKRATAIKNAASRATALTRQLLNYAGQDVPSAEAVSVSHTVEEMQLLLEAFAQSNTKLVFELKPDVPWIEVDASHVGQVVMNLVVNASEALQPAGGTIEVRTGAIHLSEADLADCVIGSDGSEGVYAFVEVADEGPGIAPADRERVFDPLFSTRAASRGLGLTAVAEVVRGYGGALELETAPGKGTRVRVLFPLAAPAEEHEDVRESTAADSLSAAFGTDAGRGTILVVDDDANARALMADVLRGAGFQVREAASGPVAMSIFERHTDSLDAVVLDYAMPLVSGADLFDAMRTLAPGVRAVMVSGYAPGDSAHDLMRRGLSGWVQKPFEPDELVAAVDEAMSASQDVQA